MNMLLFKTPQFIWNLVARLDRATSKRSGFKHAKKFGFHRSYLRIGKHNEQCRLPNAWQLAIIEAHQAHRRGIAVR